jgi:hypothetical protein
MPTIPSHINCRYKMDQNGTNQQTSKPTKILAVPHKNVPEKLTATMYLNLCLHFKFKNNKTTLHSNPKSYGP